MDFKPKYHVNKDEYDKLDFIVLEKSVTNFYMAKFFEYSPEEIAQVDTGTAEVNDMMRFVYRVAKKAVHDGTHSDIEEAMQTGICYYQNYVQMKRWYKRKQIYSFDAEILNELIRTDIENITLPHNIFNHLPCDSLCLDFSANKQITRLIGAERCVVQVNPVRLRENGEEYHVILVSFYNSNDTNMMKAVVLPNEEGSSDISVKDFIKPTTSLGLYISCNADVPVGCHPELQELLVLQCLIYLCSYEPDIHETVVSKAQHRKAKQNKKKRNDLPNREFKVGERFGAAFRKWTKGQLGQSSEHTETGRKNKPHLRRAHWHRFWVGKRNSEERRLVIKWLSECLCGVSENEAEARLDTVKHEVKGES